LKIGEGVSVEKWVSATLQVMESPFRNDILLSIRVPVVLRLRLRLL
jgi:hypothetical protein